MTAKKTVREHARERGALDGADAQALEGALSMTERERDEALAKYQFMVDRAADEKLDGYRELASRLERAVSECDKWRTVAEANKLLREDIIPLLGELVEWADNWLPDEAKDQGARDVLRRCKRVLEKSVEEQVEFVRKAIELGCYKYIGEPAYVGTFPERQDIPVEPKAP